MVNLILTIWAALQFGSDDGIGTAFEGSCEVVNSWATWLHIIINALSSILLSASNYTMQCLSAPTRREIDKAHARGDWMDIGVAGMRNLFKIRWPRIILWWCLALSSVPIHLLYNSAVFKTLDANTYSQVLANEEFLRIGNFSTNGLQGEPKAAAYDVLDHYNKNSTSFVRLENADCIAAYGTAFVSGHNDLITITAAQPNNAGNVTVFDGHQPQYSFNSGSNLPYGWICEDTSDSYYYCDTAAAKKNATNWTMKGYKIDYCLAEVLPSHCKLEFSVHILTAVILMNFVKSASMFLTMWKQRDPTLVTVGDAISSFLDNPDELTRGRCLMGKVDVNTGPMRWKVRDGTRRPNTNPPPITYHAPLRRRWFAAASVKRWITTMTLCILAIITAGVLLGIAMSSLTDYIQGSPITNMGFGAVDSRALIDIGLPTGGASGLVSSVLLANLPQAIVSFLYLMYNGLYTCMLLSNEWSKYAVRRIPLRVTTPRGEQRSTYYLQLPYTYGLPLIIASGTLHWLISESIFLARVSVYDNGTEESDSDISQVGYSCAPILCTILLGSTMLLICLGMGARKFQSHMPVVASCSAAIAAACHRPKDDVDAAVLPVQWGDIHSEGTDQIGHCGFTSDDVQDMIPGRLYAGARVEDTNIRRRNV